VADHASESEFQRLLIDEAVARSRVLFPREMLDRRIAEHTRAFMELLDQRKINLEQFLGSTRQDLTTLESEIARVAEEALKRSLVLSELLAHHKIRISMEDVEQYVDQLAEVEGMKRTRMRRRLEEDGRMGRFLDVQFTKQLCEVLEKQVQVREVTA
jgi:FKBP-type peptidyl-prolyl cis-trans isomerase (trigger factor)